VITRNKIPKKGFFNRNVKTGFYNTTWNSPSLGVFNYGDKGLW